MHTKTIEGLVGASMNMKMLNTPFRIYKEARQRGDTSAMERAMGYVGDFADKAQDYQKKAEKGMEEDAKEAREKAKTEQENAIRRRREEQDEKPGPDQAGTDGGISVEETEDVIKTEPVIYTKTGETVKEERYSAYAAWKKEKGGKGER